MEMALSPDFLNRVRCRSLAAMRRVQISAKPSTGCPASQFSILNGWDLYVYVNAVEERPGALGDVALDLIGGVHMHSRDLSIPKGLVVPERMEVRAMGTLWSSSGWRMNSNRFARELRQLVTEEQAVLGEGDLAGTRDDAITDEAGVGAGVIG